MRVNGFIASSSFSSPGYEPYGSFNNLKADGANGSRTVNTVPSWLQSQCPEPVKIWKVGLKCRAIATTEIVTENDGGHSFTVQITEWSQSMWAERERSGKRSGAGRKSVERERSGKRRSQKTIERERSAELRSGNGAESGLNWALKDRSDFVRSRPHRDVKSVGPTDNRIFKFWFTY